MLPNVVVFDISKYGWNISGGQTDDFMLVLIKQQLYVLDRFEEFHIFGEKKSNNNNNNNDNMHQP